MLAQVDSESSVEGDKDKEKHKKTDKGKEDAKAKPAFGDNSTEFT
jgi:hypothetical protein